MYYGLIKKMLQYTYVNTVERVQIRLLDFAKNPPVFIYQMGKVGSSTVYRSLKKNKLSNPVFHVHFLTFSGIKNAEKSHKSIKSEPIPYHIQLSKLLRNKLNRSSNTKMKIITLVREPIGHEISGFFQNIKLLNANLIADNGRINNDKALSFLENKIKKYNNKTGYIDTWFDNEIKAVFNIDVFDHPFDHIKGFCIVRQKNIDLLILRLEDLNRNFSRALTDFLSLKQPVEMIKTNIGKNKKYASVYQYVKKHIVIPESVCRKIYNSRFSTHFYNEKMREGFIGKWTGTN